jgi:metal-responsive CopG/Arc/MetJ family transcriptional regulator
MTDPLDFSLTPKKLVQKSLRLPEELVEELEAIARENTTDDASYTFTDVATDFLRKAVDYYRQKHPRPLDSSGKPTKKTVSK